MFPHGFCIHWDPALLTINVLMDALIALAYYVIPLMLIRAWRLTGRDLPAWANVDLLFWFAVFIFSCGTAHVMNIVVIWKPMYYFEAWVKTMTAIASVGTAIEVVKEFRRIFKSRNNVGTAIKSMEMKLGVR